MPSTQPNPHVSRDPSPLRRYAGIFLGLWRNSLIREMGFKANFLLWIVVELLWFVLQLCFINVLYLHTETIGTWTRWQVIALVGASHFIQQIFTALFLNNLAQLSEHIRTGRLDFLLLLPVNTRFLVSFRQVDLGAFINAASAVVVMGYAAVQLKITPSWLELLGFAALAITGVAIHYSLMLLLACSSFWTIRAQGIVWGYYNLFNVARLPDSAFRGFFKVLFTYALPMLLVANVPTKVLIRHLSHPGEIALLISLAILCFCASEWFWRWSLRHYTSASS